MAVTEVVDVDNADMWQSATEPAAKEAPPPAPPEPQAEPPPERARDDLGRFVKATPEPPPTQVEPVKEEEPPQVPSWRLREIREERDAEAKRFSDLQRQYAADRQQMAELQRQLAELQRPKQEPIDFFQNPDGALQQRLSPIEERFAQLEATMKLNSSKALAVAMHGKEAVAEMEAAIEKVDRNRPDIQLLAHQMRSSDDPVGAAMEWFRREKLQSETGGDLAAYRQKLLKDPAFLAEALGAARGQAQTPQGQPPPVKLPVSLSKVSGTPATAEVDDNDDSSQAMWRSATAGMRRR